MARQGYNTSTPRIAKQKGAILKHAVPVEVLGFTGNQHDMDKNNSDTVVFRRFLPTGGATTNSTTINQWSVDENNHLIQEGVTPAAETIAPQDITVTLNQYGCLYSYTDKTETLYEDDIPMYMKELTGQRMGLVREMIRYGMLKGCTNKFYAGGTSRATVDEAVSLAILRRITKTLIGNRCKMVTKILEASNKYNTSAVEGGFLVYVHSDAENDIRELPGFIGIAEYGSRKTIHELELGSVERFRFIVSPELSPILAGGAAIGTTGLVSAGAANVDIYPFIVVAEDAWGDVALRGMNSFNLTDLRPGQKDKNDPLGQRGYVGATFWSASFIQNDGWMAVLEAGVTDV